MNRYKPSEIGEKTIMMNTNNRELNMNELAMVTGGIRVKGQKEAFNENDPMNNLEVEIPRGGRVQVRV